MYIGSSVAAWLSETVLRGRGPGASGFESHRSRVVEGRATLFRHHREVSRVRIPGRMGLPWMLCCVRFVSSRKGKRGEGGRGWPGKVPRKKEKKLVDRKVPDRPIW
jgi:hypothetical protein